MDEHKKGRNPKVSKQGESGHGTTHKYGCYLHLSTLKAHCARCRQARYKASERAYTKAHQHSGIVWPQMPLQGTWGGYDGR